jgi:hypothetical protein
MNSNTPSLLNASDISSRNGGLPFVGADAFHRNALWSRLVRSPQMVLRIGPTSDARPGNSSPCFDCTLLATVKAALRPCRFDSIPIASPPARRFSPTGFLAYRSRWWRRAAHRTRHAASARLKTLRPLCTPLHNGRLHSVATVSFGAFNYHWTVSSISSTPAPALPEIVSRCIGERVETLVAQRFAGDF